MILSKDTELKILGCIFRHQVFCDAVANEIDPKLFSMALDRNIAKIAVDQFNQHKCLATQHIFGHEIKKMIDKNIIKEDEKEAYVKRYIEILKVDISDWSYVLDSQLVPFIKKRMYSKLAEDMVRTLIPNEKFEEIDSRSAHIGNIGIAEQAPYVSTFNPESVKTRKEDRLRELNLIGQGVARIPFGVPKLDAISGGGINREKDRLIVFAAPPKVGKSMSLLHYAEVASAAGNNVAYFSYETSISVLQDRLDANISGVKINDVLTRIDDVDMALNDQDGRGEIFFFKYATGIATAETVKRDVLRLEQTTGKKIDLVIVDYLDISKRDETVKDENKAETLLWESYRRVAEQLGIPLLSATQISSKAGDKSIIKSDKVLGSTGKLASVDALFIISGSEKDLKNGKIYVTSSTCRNIEKVSFSIKSAYAYGKFFTAMDQDEVY